MNIQGVGPEVSQQINDIAKALVEQYLSKALQEDSAESKQFSLDKFYGRQAEQDAEEAGDAKKSSSQSVSEDLELTEGANAALPKREPI